MKTEKIESPIYKKAYRVKGWGDKIQTGMAFTLKHIDWYERTKAFFIPDGKELPEMLDAKEVVYSKKEADELLISEKKARKEYYQRQIKEANENLKTCDA